MRSYPAGRLWRRSRCSAAFAIKSPRTRAEQHPEGPRLACSEAAPLPDSLPKALRQFYDSRMTWSFIVRNTRLRDFTWTGQRHSVTHSMTTLGSVVISILCSHSWHSRTGSLSRRRCSPTPRNTQSIDHACADSYGCMRIPILLSLEDDIGIPVSKPWLATARR